MAKYLKGIIKDDIKTTNEHIKGCSLSIIIHQTPVNQNCNELPLQLPEHFVKDTITGVGEDVRLLDLISFRTNQQ